MSWPIAERFKAPQGEGLYTGVQMAFMRFVGCSVGKGVCHACDTEFDRVRSDLGGGLYHTEELLDWAAPCRHICLTGGEPLDRDIRELLLRADTSGLMVHIETSGTVRPRWLGTRLSEGWHGIQEPMRENWERVNAWLTVSPKPGWKPEMIEGADEVKVILGGLGPGPGWPTLEDAVRWADAGKLVYVQQVNDVASVDRAALARALDAVAAHPQLRLSCQLHKFLETR